MQNRTSQVVGWSLSILLVAFLAIASAGGKFTEWEGKDEMFQKLGFQSELMFKIGILEVVLALLFLVPRASFVAAILLTGYLGGAVVTHLRVHDPFVFPIIIGVVMWLALGLRNPAVFNLALGNSISSNPRSVE